MSCSTPARRRTRPRCATSSTASRPAAIPPRGEDRLIAIADLGFGYPEPEDAYLGLMLVDPAHRGNGLGPLLLAHVEGLARERGAPRLVIGVLEANARALAFWERQGFRRVRTIGPVARGRRRHLVHRLERRLPARTELSRG